MRILSLNTHLAHWGLDRSKRIKPIVKKINSLNLDIICLQEVFIKKDAKELEYLLKKSCYKYFYHVKNLFVASKYKIFNKSYKIFKEQGRLFSYSFLDVLYQKAFQYFLLKKEKIIVINTHLLSGAGKQKRHYKNVRESQVLEILKHVKKKKKVIFLGDFNFLKNSEAYKLIKEEGFIDKSKNITKPTFPEKRIKIDYVFVKGIKDGKVKLVKMGSLSDHRGLILEINN